MKKNFVLAFLIVAACTPDLPLPKEEDPPGNVYVPPSPTNPGNGGQGGSGPPPQYVGGEGGTPSNDAGAGGAHSTGGSPSNGGSGGAELLCIPGASIACVGPAGCSGYQVCAADGMHYESCICQPGSGGSGGSPSNDGGAGGSEPSGGQGGSPSNGGSGGGGGSNPNPVMGNLTIVVLHPNQTTDHLYDLYKAPEWITPAVTQNAQLFAANVVLNEGVKYVFNGQTDDGDWRCGGAGQKTVLIVAYWNGKSIPLQVNIWGNGCNFEVIAKSVVCPANDQDCDGFFADDPVQSKKDCDDLVSMKFPGQIETTGDQFDANCNGAVDQ